MNETLIAETMQRAIYFVGGMQVIQIIYYVVVVYLLWKSEKRQKELEVKIEKIAKQQRKMAQDAAEKG